MKELDLKEIQELCERATPGPWAWDISINQKSVELITVHSGRYYVMDFVRWGMHSACPRFQQYENFYGSMKERESHGMIRADGLGRSYPGKEHHKGFDCYIDHPDAIFIARSRELVPAMLAEIQSIRAELKEAVSDMKETHCMGSRCYICKRSIDCERQRVEVGHCGMFQWRGEREGKDES